MKKIGEGNFGLVYIGTWNSFDVALKSIKEEKNIPAFVEEITLLKDLRHPGIVSVFGFTMIDDEFFSRT